MKIKGNYIFEGEMNVSGCVDEALAVIAASVLSDGNIEIRNIPDVPSVREMIEFLKGFRNVRLDGDVFYSKGGNLDGEIRYKPVGTGILFLGPLAIRTGHSRISYNPGSSIGPRPIDIHIEGLKQLGIDVKEEGDFIDATFRKAPKEAKIEMRFPSIRETEHLMMTSVLLKGTTVEISNCARESEVVDLARFLKSMGAKISGIGKEKMIVKGVGILGNTSYSVIGDIVETGTYMIGALTTKGTLKINGIGDEINNVVNFLKKIGSKIEILQRSVVVYPSDVKDFRVMTGPYPEFPTNLQSQIMLLGCYADSLSQIIEIGDGVRPNYIKALKQMGADIDVDGNQVIVRPSKLHGTSLNLKGGTEEKIALLLAARIADGESEIEGIERVFEKHSLSFLRN